VQECEWVSKKCPYCVHCKLCDIMIVVCWQVWAVIREESVVAVKKGCHVVALGKQHLGYHESCE
jgi:hypothetical protein